MVQANETGVMVRPDETHPDWRDWKWQQRNTVRSPEGLLERFPGMDSRLLERIRLNLGDRKLTVTPYALGLIETDETGRPLETDPILNQVLPLWDRTDLESIEYDGETENWELPEEMVSPICQHKYENRVIIRLSNVCHSYCQFCYEALRTLEPGTAKEALNQRHWRETVAYIENNDQVDEAILSGGEPLMQTDRYLHQVLSDLRGIDRDLVIRVHTRALTFNPFRITDALLASFEQNGVAAVGLHVTHPREVTDEFVATARRIQRVVPIMFANIPLLNGINADERLMRDFVLKLYGIGVIPHYLYHFLPFSPGSGKFRTSVQKGIDIVKSLKRHVSNMAVPEFVLPHHTGKFTPPLFYERGHMPTWVDSEKGSLYSFFNWKGQQTYYPDIHARE